jgi:hypothetical protein
LPRFYPVKKRLLQQCGFVQAIGVFYIDKAVVM